MRVAFPPENSNFQQGEEGIIVGDTTCLAYVLFLGPSGKGIKIITKSTLEVINDALSPLSFYKGRSGSSMFKFLEYNFNDHLCPLKMQTKSGRRIDLGVGELFREENLSPKGKIEVGDEIVCAVKNRFASRPDKGKVVYANPGDDIYGVEWEKDVGGNDLSLLGYGPLCEDGHGEIVSLHNIYRPYSSENIFVEVQP